MSLYIEQVGHGAVPLVLIHGWGMHGGLFAPLIDVLADQCTFYVVDLPGHGYSRDCTLVLTARDCAAAIAAETPPALWLGWSMGGQIALTAALEYPQQVRALAMLCATPRFLRAPDWDYAYEPEPLQQLATDLESDYDATLARFMAMETMGSIRVQANLKRLQQQVFVRGQPTVQALQEGISMLQGNDLRSRLPQLDVPNIWIAGARDRVVPPGAMRAAAVAAKGEFVELADTGHAPFFSHAGALGTVLQPMFEGVLDAAM